MQRYLAVDIDASSGRHIVGWQEDGEIRTREVYRFPNGVRKADGHLTWDVEGLLAHVIEGIGRALDAYPDVVSLSIDTWGVDYVLLRGVKTDRPLTDEASRAANYSNEGGVGYNRYQKNIMGMWLVNCLQRELCPDTPFPEIVKAAGASACEAVVDANAAAFLAPASMKAAFDEATGGALHVTRPIRWDSDHVVLFDDETREICKEIVRCGGLEGRVNIALDYFDASINRVAAWVMGVRNVHKALLYALLTPNEDLRALQNGGDFTSLLVRQEEYGQWVCWTFL